MPIGHRLLRRLRHLGTNRPTKNLRQRRRLPRRELVLPRRRRGTTSRLGSGQSLSKSGVDQADQHAGSNRRDGDDATGDGGELHDVGHRGVFVRVRRVSVRAGVVEAPQLLVVWCARRWIGVYGSGVVFVFGV